MTKKTKRYDEGGTVLEGMRRDFRNAIKDTDAAQETAEALAASRAGRKYYAPQSKWDEENAADSAAKEVSHLAKLHPNKGRGVIDTSNVDENTLLPKKMAKGGQTKPAAKGWGIARGARKAKMY